jgi:protease-4
MRPTKLAVLGLLWLSTALAQTASIDSLDLSRGLTLPPTGVALIDNATSPSENPAGLTFVGGGELQYLHERNLAVSQTGDALFLATRFGHVGLAFGEEWLRPGPLPHYRRTTWALSFGGELLSLGGALHLYSSDLSDLDRISSFDLGLTTRPTRYLAFGATVQNLDQRTEGALSFGRRFDFGVGVRPLGERFTLGLDFLFNEAAGASNGVLQGTLALGLFQGMTLGAGVAKGFGTGGDWRVQVGLTVDGAHAGLTYAGGGASEGADHVIAVRLSSAAYPSLSFGEGKLALFDLEDLLQPPGGVGALLGFPHADPYIRLTELLDRAARDPSLEGVVLKVNGLPGVSTGKAEE